MPTLDDPVIDRYLDALWLEKGWPITVGRPIATTSPHSTVGCRSAAFGWRRRAGGHSRSPRLAPEQWQGAPTARFRLRGFYRYLLREGEISLDPTLRVDLPAWAAATKALSEADVEALLAAPDTGDPLGLRDRAMLEVLYACGLRVTELISLTLSR